MPKENKQPQQEKQNKSEVLQRLAQGAIEGLIVEVAMNTLIPGSGIALNGLRQGKNLKKVAKAMGKSATKEGVQMLDDSEENPDKPEELAGDIALEFITRTAGCGR